MQSVSKTRVLGESIGKSAADYATLTWSDFFLGNLIPVILGNIFGGSFTAGLVYWFIHSLVHFFVL